MTFCAPPAARLITLASCPNFEWRRQREATGSRRPSIPTTHLKSRSDPVQWHPFEFKMPMASKKNPNNVNAIESHAGGGGARLAWPLSLKRAPPATSDPRSEDAPASVGSLTVPLLQSVPLSSRGERRGVSGKGGGGPRQRAEDFQIAGHGCREDDEDLTRHETPSEEEGRRAASHCELIAAALERLEEHRPSPRLFSRAHARFAHL